MSLFIASLNSGSNGNCYYIGNRREAVLVDLGISCRELEKRMKRLELDMGKVKAIFISHEHTDHISGLAVTSRKHRIPVFITPPTLQNSRLQLDHSLVSSFCADVPVAIGALSITPFTKHHDAADPFSFLVEGQGIKVGVFTDIGHSCPNVIRHFKQCHAAFLEANYDEQMLEESAYPIYLKKRISGEKGHLSNEQSLDLFRKHRPAFLNHLFLAHLSKNNNKPELVQELFSTQAGSTNIVVASRYEESAVYEIQQESASKPGSKTSDLQMKIF
jgi:phosphoribosyl 1,2-cyclic phosphodiesterase